ncbi:hypothetical protein [Marinitoga lauensis]|uniref:hypothetical protein n=1 Tax=Marinitoga lauensis TaxID=2201189 RepID=UPI0010101A1A|nr:hypothetical protein [Marinitoga lauensis]
MNEFYPDVYAGNLIDLSISKKGISSGTFIVNSVKQNLSANKFETVLDITEWKNITFDINNKTITKTITDNAITKPPEQTQIEQIQGDVQTLQAQVDQVDNRTNYIDGNPPADPTGLSLTTINENGLSFIKASWDTNTESDLIGYELAWSYDGTDWNYIKTSEALVKFEVAGNKTIYVKLRALDAEGKKSNWTTVSQITSAKDETPPAIPTGLTATGLFQKIQVSWNANSEEDFKEYELQVATDSGFTQNVITIKVSATQFTYAGNTNTTYYFRIRAIDESGNISNWSTSVSATTAKVYDADLESQRLNDAETAIAQNQADINTLNNTTIPNLQTDINNNRTDIDTLNNTTIPDLNDKLSYKALALPAGVIAYWTNSLLDDIQGIKPVGYDYVNLDSIIQVVEDNIPNGTITETKIADDSISTPKLKANSISSDKIIAGAITTEKIAAGAVTANEIAANSISAIHIQADAVEAEKIKAGSITADKIASNAITTDKLDANAVTTDKIAANAITANEIATGAITADKVAAGAITTEKLSASAVTAEKIGAGEITATHIGTNEIITNSANIATGVIKEAHIADASIAEAKIKDAAITNAKIADLAVDDAKIANIDASKITTGYLDADRIEAGSITADKLILGVETSLPKGAIAYWVDSLVDVINYTVPVEYTEVEERSYASELPSGTAIIKRLHTNEKITVGDENEGYGIDGQDGFLKYYQGQSLPFVNIYDVGTLSIKNGATEATRTFPTPWKSANYEVLLFPLQHKIYDNDWVGTERVLKYGIKDKTTSGFTVYCYEEFSNDVYDTETTIGVTSVYNATPLSERSGVQNVTPLEKSDGSLLYFDKTTVTAERQDICYFPIAEQTFSLTWPKIN